MIKIWTIEKGYLVNFHRILILKATWRSHLCEGESITSIVRRWKREKSRNHFPTSYISKTEIKRQTVKHPFLCFYSQARMQVAYYSLLAPLVEAPLELNQVGSHLQNLNDYKKVKYIRKYNKYESILRSLLWYKLWSISSSWQIWQQLPEIMGYSRTASIPLKHLKMKKIRYITG